MQGENPATRDAKPASGGGSGDAGSLDFFSRITKQRLYELAEYRQDTEGFQLFDTMQEVENFIPKYANVLEENSGNVITSSLISRRPPSRNTPPLSDGLPARSE